jgi:hypothetical protein
MNVIRALLNDDTFALSNLISIDGHGYLLADNND